MKTVSVGLLLFSISGSVIADPGQQRIDACYRSVASTLDSRVQSALKSIEGLDRQVLALRSYLRSGDNLNEHWSWTEEEIGRYQSSSERQQALAELEQIKREFAAQNPGYELDVNTQVRSLNVQLERWNTNASVARVADDLQRAAEKQLASKSVTCDGFGEFLQSWFAHSPPALAAPGLSRHGQARAFDFYVKRGSTIVAGTDMAMVKPVWDDQGWTNKLKRAVQTASNKFSGPLQNPREPWHYEYDSGNGTDGDIRIALSAVHSNDARR